MNLCQSKFECGIPVEDNTNFNEQLQCLQQSLAKVRSGYNIINEIVKALPENMKSLEQQEEVKFDEQAKDLAKMQPETEQEQQPTKKGRGRPPKNNKSVSK